VSITNSSSENYKFKRSSGFVLGRGIPMPEMVNLEATTLSPYISGLVVVFILLCCIKVLCSVTYTPVAVVNVLILKGLTSPKL
jgi:hypothetical protein